MANLVFQQLWNNPNNVTGFIDPTGCGNTMVQALAHDWSPHDLAISTKQSPSNSNYSLRLEIHASSFTNCGQTTHRIEPNYYPYYETAGEYGSITDCWWGACSWWIGSAGNNPSLDQWPSSSNGLAAAPMVMQWKKHGSGLSEVEFGLYTTSSSTNVPVNINKTYSRTVGQVRISNTALTFTRNQWNHIVIRENRHPTNGLIKIWKNGNVVVNHTGAVGYYGPDYGLSDPHRHKFGFYYTGSESGSGIATLFNANIRIARGLTTEPDAVGYALVDPTQGTSPPPGDFSVNAGGPYSGEVSTPIQLNGTVTEI